MTSALEYVVNSLAWSLVGFALGWLVASLRYDVSRIKEKVMPEERPHEPHPRARATTTRWLGTVVLLMAAVTVIQGVIVTERLSRVTECQADYNDRFAEVATRRAALATEDQQALQDMLLALYRQRGANEARRLTTFENWVETVQRNAKERRANPLPGLPEGDCR